MAYDAPKWKVMFSFAGKGNGGIRAEVRKIAEFFADSPDVQMDRHDIFFDEWTIPVGAHLDTACQIGVRRSETIVFVVNETFLKRESTLDEYHSTRRPASAILFVFYEQDNGTWNADSIKRVSLSFFLSCN